MDLKCSSFHADSHDVAQRFHTLRMFHQQCLRVDCVQSTVEEEPTVKRPQHKHSQAEPAYAFRRGSARILQDDTGLGSSLNKRCSISIASSACKECRTSQPFTAIRIDLACWCVLDKSAVMHGLSHTAVYNKALNGVFLICYLGVVKCTLCCTGFRVYVQL